MQTTTITAEEDLLTFKEATDYLRVSRSTLFRIMWRGDITGSKIGDNWRFTRGELQRYVTASRVHFANSQV